MLQLRHHSTHPAAAAVILLSTWTIMAAAAAAVVVMRIIISSSVGKVTCAGGVALCPCTQLQQRSSQPPGAPGACLILHHPHMAKVLAVQLWWWK
jgi:hypothetical protein